MQPCLVFSSSLFCDLVEICASLKVNLVFLLRHSLAQSLNKIFYISIISCCISYFLGTGKDYKSALGILMQLRKVSNHPLLERYIYGTDLLTKMAHDYCDVSSRYVYKSLLNSLILEDAYPSCFLSL